MMSEGSLSSSQDESIDNEVVWSSGGPGSSGIHTTPRRSNRSMNLGGGSDSAIG